MLVQYKMHYTHIQRKPIETDCTRDSRARRRALYRISHVTLGVAKRSTRVCVSGLSLSTVSSVVRNLHAEIYSLYVVVVVQHSTS